MENNKITYYKEQIAHIYYNFVRPREEIDIKNCAVLYEQLLRSLVSEIKTTSAEREPSEIEDTSPIISNYVELFKLLYKLIAQTRDICNGKGERDLTYMMIYTWWKYFPTMGLVILRAMLFSLCGTISMEHDEQGHHTTHLGINDFSSGVKIHTNPHDARCMEHDAQGHHTTHLGINLHIDTNLPYFPHMNSYGCLKDVKYFCNYVRVYGSKNDIICRYAMIMLNQRVYNDYMEYQKNGTLPSLACKWVPRENSKHGWIFEKMAIQWVQATQPYILSSVKTNGEDINWMWNVDIDVSLVRVKAITKCKTIYRKVISSLTKLIDISETKKCENRWSEIVPAKITIRDWECNNNALFNIDNTFQERHNTAIDKDRRMCAHNIKEHLFISQMSPDTVLTNFVKSYTNRRFFTPMQFVKHAIHIIQQKKIERNAEMQQNILYQTNMLNNMWEKLSKKCNTLDYFIPILDTSLSMRGEPLHNAIGMCCLIAEKSKIERRVMVMDNVPTWVNLEKCANFVEMVEMLYSYTTRYAIANLLRTFDGLIEALAIESSHDNGANGVSSSGSNAYVFVVFTNEYSFWKYENDMVHPVIMDKFSSVNLDIPHIVYWNCANANADCSVPALSNTKRVSMVSGTNANLLNHFSFIGWGNLYNNNAVETMENILANSRYDEVEDLFNAYFHV